MVKNQCLSTYWTKRRFNNKIITVKFSSPYSHRPRFPESNSLVITIEPNVKVFCYGCILLSYSGVYSEVMFIIDGFYTFSSGKSSPSLFYSTFVFLLCKDYYLGAELIFLPDFSISFLIFLF